MGSTPTTADGWSTGDVDWSGFSDGLEIDDDEFARAILAGRRAEMLSSADPFRSQG